MFAQAPMYDSDDDDDEDINHDDNDHDDDNDNDDHNNDVCVKGPGEESRPRMKLWIPLAGCTMSTRHTW